MRFVEVCCHKKLLFLSGLKARYVRSKRIIRACYTARRWDTVKSLRRREQKVNEKLIGAEHSRKLVSIECLPVALIVEAGPPGGGLLCLFFLTRIQGIFYR